MEAETDYIFLGSKTTADGDCSHEIRRHLLLGRKPVTNLDRHHFADKSPYSQNHGWMWELDHKEGWMPKNWWFQTVVLEKTFEIPLDSKKIKPVNPKGNQPWTSLEGWCWSWSSNTLATWGEQLTHWKRPWCWVKLRPGGEEGGRGWDG